MNSNEYNILKLENRLARLRMRADKKNGNIIKSLERELRVLKSKI